MQAFLRYVIIFGMKVDLAKYANMNICVAVSGGKDSVSLLHFLHAHGGEYGIKLSALNCDHKIRGKASLRDSAFVKKLCEEWCIPLICFAEDCVALAKTRGVSLETAARDWRRECYFKAAAEMNADAVACAHHLNDNAETVLFNLSRGAASAGLTGITDSVFIDGNSASLKIIHPLIACSRDEIERYVKENKLSFVTDKSNFKDDYTRNRLRHNIFPELESIIPGAAKAMYRSSRLAAEDEAYFYKIIEKTELISTVHGGIKIAFCEEKVLFRRAVIKVIRDCFHRKDYTFEHAEKLYNLQFAENGKKFEFLGLTAYREEGAIALCEDAVDTNAELLFNAFKSGIFGGVSLKIDENPVAGMGKILRFDADCIPENAVLRFMKEGDKFTKFGGGTKNLGDYFTDRKIPVRLRGKIPLIAVDNVVLAVCGVEISDIIKVTEKTVNCRYICCDIMD